jgi:hypothetical protein
MNSRNNSAKPQLGEQMSLQELETAEAEFERATRGLQNVMQDKAGAA